MAKLSPYRYELIHRILTTIRACEGGRIDITALPNGDIILRLIPDIPMRLWCDACKKCAICESKLMTRWTKKEE